LLPKFSDHVCSPSDADFPASLIQSNFSFNYFPLEEQALYHGEDDSCWGNLVGINGFATCALMRSLHE
jgi:hypothetical protein